MSIYSSTYNALSALGYMVKEEGTYPIDSTLPETYITYFLISAVDEEHSDDSIVSTTYRMQVNLYSKKPSIKQGADSTLKNAMLSAGFLRLSGRDLPFNSDTGHYCYSCDFSYQDYV